MEKYLTQGSSLRPGSGFGAVQAVYVGDAYIAVGKIRSKLDYLWIHS